MRSPLHAPTALATLALCTGLLALTAFARPQNARTKWEYKITLDVDEEDIEDLAKEGWEFAGYLGTSKRGTSVDEVLWKRPAK